MEARECTRRDGRSPRQALTVADDHPSLNVDAFTLRAAGRVDLPEYRYPADSR